MLGCLGKPLDLVLLLLERPVDQRPVDPPEDRVIRDAAAEASPAFVSTRPSPIAEPSMTSATDRTRPSSVNQFRITPTTSPPVVGIKSTHHQSSDAAKE